MGAQRKLGRPSDQRQALLRNQVTHLLWHGKIETTLQRAKEVRRVAEHMITLAVRECDNSVMVEKSFSNEKGQIVKQEFKNDLPSKLSARRRMLSYLYDLQELRKDKESRTDYRERTKDVKHPIVEKLFSDIGPKFKKRKEETGTGGGYTRIIRMGPRRGDAAEMVILEII